MKKKVLLIISLMTTMLAAGCGEVGVGYIDGEKVMEAPAIKAIREEGEKKLEETEATIKAELETKSEATEEEKTKAQMEAQRKLIGVQQAYATQLKQKIDAAIASAIKGKNIDVVLENTEPKTVIEGGIDLTEEVVQKLQQ